MPTRVGAGALNPFAAQGLTGTKNTTKIQQPATVEAPKQPDNHKGLDGPKPEQSNNPPQSTASQTKTTIERALSTALTRGELPREGSTKALDVVSNAVTQQSQASTNSAAKKTLATSQESISTPEQTKIPIQGLTTRQNIDKLIEKFTESKDQTQTKKPVEISLQELLKVGNLPKNADGKIETPKIKEFLGKIFSPNDVDTLISKKSITVEPRQFEGLKNKLEAVANVSETRPKIENFISSIGPDITEARANIEKLGTLGTKVTEAKTILAQSKQELAALPATGFNNYKKELTEFISKLENDIPKFENNIKEQKENCASLIKNGNAVNAVVKDLESISLNFIERGRFENKIAETVGKMADGPLKVALLEHVETLKGINDISSKSSSVKGEDIWAPLPTASHMERQASKDDIIMGIIDIIKPKKFEEPNITMGKPPKKADEIVPTKPDIKPIDDTKPADIVQTPAAIECRDFFVKDRPVFLNKVNSLIEKANTDGSLMLNPRMFRELRKFADTDLVFGFTKNDAHEMMKSVLVQATGRSAEEISANFDDRGMWSRAPRPGISLSPTEVKKALETITDHSFSDLGSITKFGMKKLGIDELTSFESGSSKSKKIEIGASVGASIAVSDVLKAIPLPGLGDALAAAMSKIADGKATGNLSLDGGVGMNASKNNDGTISLNLDFTIKAAAQGKLELTGAAVTNQSKELSGSQTAQHRVTYNFKNENEISEFLNGGKFREVKSTDTIDTKQFSITSSNSRIGTTKNAAEKDEKLEGINDGDKVSRKITEKSVKTVALGGVNSPSIETVRNTVKIRDDDKLLSKMEVISVKSQGINKPEALSLNVSFDTIKDAKEGGKIGELAQRFAEDFSESMKGKGNVIRDIPAIKVIFVAKLTELAGSIEKIEGSLDHKAKNKISETDLKFLKISTKSTDLVGFQIPFKAQGNNFTLDADNTAFTLKERKGLGGSIGLGDFFQIGAKGTSATDKIIGTINNAQTLAQNEKQGTSIVDKVQTVAGNIGKVIDTFEKAEKILEKPKVIKFSDNIGAGGLLNNLTKGVKTVNSSIEDSTDAMKVVGPSEGKIVKPS